MKNKSDVAAAVRGGSHVVFSEDMLHEVSSTLKYYGVTLEKESLYFHLFCIYTIFCVNCVHIKALFLKIKCLSWCPKHVFLHTLM